MEQIRAGDGETLSRSRRRNSGRALLMTKRGTRVRILQVGKFYPPYAGGIETHLEELCAQLSNFADVEVIVANTSRRNITEQISGIKVHRAGTVANFANVPISPGMVAAIRRSNADIVHIHWPNPMAVLAYLASGHTGRLVLTYHSDIVKQKAVGWPSRPLFNLLMRSCRWGFAPSPHYVDGRRVLLLAPSLCQAIRLGISPEMRT